MKICLSCEGISATEHEQCGHCGAALLPMDAVHFPLRRGEADATNPLLGSLLDGKYRIQGVLGRGGMGTVFRAVHEVSLVPLAIKLLHPRFGLRADFRRLLVAEARRAGRVVDEHCARILDVGETEDGTVYLAMELAAGETLDLWLRGGKGLPPHTAVEILAQVCHALVAIHGAGLVHRDLSLRNVMVAVRDGRPWVKVLDFGIAKASFVGRAAEGDPEGALFGNPVFSAPEHLAGSPSDARADIYSLGVLAHCMLTGHLPVRDTDPREAAAATVQGRIDVFPAVPGVPRSLQRLVQRCVALDPARRPASAAEVLRELDALLRADHSRLRAFSLAALGVAMVTAVLTWGGSTNPFLESTPGSPLVIVPGPVARGAVPRILRSEDLATVSFAFGGFQAGRLQVELAHGGIVLSQVALAPVVDREHARLVLSVGQQEWRNAVAGIASESAAADVDVRFLVPGVAALGSARLRIDDLPPVAALVPVEDSVAARVLSAATTLAVHAQDLVGISRCTLELRGEAIQEDFELAVDATQVLAGDVLASRMPGVESTGPVALSLRVVDLAGNESVSEPVLFDACDLAAPMVLECAGAEGDDAVWHLAGSADLRVRTSAHEPGLVFRVRDPLGTVRILDAVEREGESTWWSARMQSAGADEQNPFPDGRWSVEVLDPAGNRSVAEFPLLFRNRDLAARWSVVGDSLAAPAGEGFVLSLDGCTLDLQTIASYSVASVAVRARDGMQPASAIAELLQSAPGSSRIRVQGLTEGAWQLLVTARPAEGVAGREVAFRRELVVLPSELVVRVPAPSGRFLPALLEDGTFVLQDGRLRPGQGWTCDGGLGTHLRGELFSGGADLVPQALVPLTDAFPGNLSFPLVPGRNLVAARLRDVLGRDVRVLRGSEVAPSTSVGGSRVTLLADFVHADQPPELVGGDLLVEHDEPVRLRLRVRQPFLESELGSVLVAFGQGEFRSVAASAAAEGMELAFLLPRDVWVRAAVVDEPAPGVPTLADASSAEFARGIRATLRGTFASPAGRFELRVPLRTVRSTLGALALGDVQGNLPVSLAGMRFVPVLAPEGVLADPLPAAAERRSSFHAGPPVDVRNLTDVFMLDTEVTQGQYVALLRVLAAIDPGAVSAARDLVHATDPLGAARLAVGAMVPAGWQADFAAFAAECELHPERAVHGVDFHQAWCWTRMLGLLVGSSHDWFRLPLGCELDLAAFAGTTGSTVRHAAALHGTRVQAAAFDAAGHPADGRAHAGVAGDVVEGAWPAPLHGLDFGVREWTCDLPVIGGPEHALLQEWAGDAPLHLRRIEEHASGRLPPTLLPARTALLGVVRGAAFTEPQLLLDPATGSRAVDAGGLLLPAVPGVTRSEHLRRDGRDVIPGAVDPRLMATGFRVVGAGAFVQYVRSMR